MTRKQVLKGFQVLYVREEEEGERARVELAPFYLMTALTSARPDQSQTPCFRAKVLAIEPEARVVQFQ